MLSQGAFENIVGKGENAGTPQRLRTGGLCFNSWLGHFLSDDC